MYMFWKIFISLDIKNCILYMYEKEIGDMIWLYFIKLKNIVGLGNRYCFDLGLGFVFEFILGCFFGWDLLRLCNILFLFYWDRIFVFFLGSSSFFLAFVGILLCFRCWFCR